MTNDMLYGLFALAGTLLGGLFTLLAARVGHDWSRARHDLVRMAEQVAAYHALEHEYMLVLHEADPDMGAPGHIQRIMRDRVECKCGFMRPTMQAKRAFEIRARYD